MNPPDGPDAFYNEIEKAFYDLIDEYKFSHFELREDVQVLKNTNCAIKLIYDRGTISCDLIDPKSKDQHEYPLYPVMNFLFPRVTSEHLAFNTRDQLTECAQLLTNHFQHVLSGDFSWTEDFLKLQEVTDKMVLYLTNNMDHNHPIYQKFKRGDMSWIQDLQLYLKQLY
jgi:hypothetical protein